MQRCHYVKDPKTGKKVLVPECWAVVQSGNIEDCYCSKKIKRYYVIVRFKDGLKWKDKNLISSGETKFQALAKVNEQYPEGRIRHASPAIEEEL